jgi:hypothetical protein
MLARSHRFHMNRVQYLRAPTEALIISDPEFDGMVDSDVLEVEVPRIDGVLELTLRKVWILEQDEIFRQGVTDTMCAILNLKLPQAGCFVI